MEKPIKIALFISHPIHYLIGFAKKLGERDNVQTHVYFGSDFGIREGIDTTFGQKVKWYDSSILDGLSHSFIKNISFSKDPKGFFSLCNPGIFKELRNKKFDAILIHGWNYFSNWLAILAGVVTKTPVIIRGESPLNQDILKPKWKILLKKIILGKMMFPLITRFLYIGEENKNFYKYYGVPENKLFFAPYSVDNNAFMQKASLLKNERNKLRSAYGVRDDQVIIMTVGKLIEKKRPMDLVKAFELLQNNSSDKDKFVLFFVGDGWLRGELEKYINKQKIKGIHFIGFKNQAELPNYYASGDIFVLASGIGETWGLVINEAMCFGLPIIASDSVGCAKNLVKNGVNGFIYPVGDIKTLTVKLEKIIKDGNMKKLGAESVRIIGDYSFDKDVDGLISAVVSCN